MESRSSCDGGSSSVEELLDPRIHLELEKLNSSTDQINKVEKELEETNEQFRVLLNAHAGGLEKLMKKLGPIINKARPYYVAKEESDDLQKKCLEAAVQFQRANDIHKEARKSVQQAECRYNAKESQFDGCHQLEILNHLTLQVMEAEKQKASLSENHRSLSEKFFEAEKKVQELEKLLKGEIVKSKAYFAQKNSLNSTLNDLRDRTMKLYNERSAAKRAYGDALHSLERISEEIHRSRNKRSPGEGEEEKDGESNNSGSKELKLELDE